MSLKKIVGDTALDFVKNENIQNKTIDLAGMLFPYMGIRKKALDLYITEIENSNLSTDAKIVSVLNAKQTIKKLKNQNSIAEIAIQNAKEGTDFSEKSGVDEEWFDRFMESAAFVSNQEMQLVWGKILANEFERPGSTPPNMTRILSEFTYNYAQAFRTLCSMRVLLVSISEEDEITNAIWRNTIVFQENMEYMNKCGITFELLNELESLGVIKFDSLAGYASTNMSDKKVLVCINGKVIETTSHRGDDFPVGNVIFTAAGEILKSITGAYELEGYEEVIKKFLKSNNVTVAEECSYYVQLLGNEIIVTRKES